MAFFDIEHYFSLAAFTDGVLVPVWLEVCVIGLFALGFATMRKHHKKDSGNQKQKSANTAKELLSHSIQEEMNNGNSKSVVALWRATKTYIPTPVATLRQVCQAFLETEPEHTEEILEHMAMFPTELCFQDAAIAILTTIGRAGNTSVMHEIFTMMPNIPGIYATPQMYEALISAYACAGKEVELERCLEEACGGVNHITARMFSLAVKGLLKAGKLDAALCYVKEMQHLGLMIPTFAVTEIFRVACESGDPRNVLEFAEKQALKPTMEAVLLLLDHCTREKDGGLARRVEAYVRACKAHFSLKVYDSFLKLYASVGDTYVLKLFEEMQQSSMPISEGLCVGLLTRCADSKLLIFAGKIVEYVRSHLKMTITMYSALMKVYAYCGMYNEACNLYTEIVGSGLEPDQIMYSCFMKFAVECNRLSFLKEIAQKVPAIDLQNSMSLIRAAMKDKDVRGAFDVLDQLKSTGVQPDVTAYNAVLNVCAVAGDLQSTEKIVAEMKTVVDMDLTSYNTAMKAYCNCGDAEGAHKMLKQMEDAGVAPNDVSYNCLINMSVSAGILDDAWKSVDHMLQRGIPADRYTIATLMKAARGSQSGHDLQRAFTLLDNSELDVCQDEVLLNSVLEACTRHRFNRRLEKILESYSKCSLTPQAHTYAALIRACGMLRLIDRAWAHWNEMAVERKIAPTEIALGCMLDALVSNGLTNEAEKLLNKWKATTPPNVVMYSTLLKGYASAHMADSAMSTLNEMRHAGMELCTKVYNSVIDAYARSGSTDDVARVVAMMDADGCPHDGFTRSLVVKGHCTNGDLDKAFEAFEKGCREENGAMDVLIFNNLLDGCVQHDRMNLADQLIQQVDAMKVKPSPFTLAIVIKMWGRLRNLDRAFEMVEIWPQKYNFTLNGPVYSSLLSACLKNNSVTRALQVFDGLRETGNGVHTKLYGSLICGCARVGLVEDAVRLAKEAYGLDPKRMGRGMPAGQTLENHVCDQLLKSIKKNELQDIAGSQLMDLLRLPCQS